MTCNPKTCVVSNNGQCSPLCADYRPEPSLLDILEMYNESRVINHHPKTLCALNMFKLNYKVGMYEGILNYYYKAKELIAAEKSGVLK